MIRNTIVKDCCILGCKNKGIRHYDEKFSPLCIEHHRNLKWDIPVIHKEDTPKSELPHLCARRFQYHDDKTWGHCVQIIHTGKCNWTRPDSGGFV